ncbi:MAG: tyrosine-type recombinase/integrase [Candidatus Thermoplasmatota archaeon]|nr:tyrosine-type recombinase/integrase [Candidatus Thermoplasmatota archaeon]
MSKDKLLGFTRQHAWKIVKRYAALAGIQDVHPHKFRHGLAIYLLQQGVPIPVISARLGHSNVYITMQLYMKVTPEIQRHFLERVPMRGD